MRTRVLPVIAVAVVLGIVVDLLTGHSPFPGYPALLGVGGGALLTLAGKVLLAGLVSRQPDFYPHDEAPAVQADVLAIGPDPRDAAGRPQDGPRDGPQDGQVRP